jgi:hypothetical protein
MKDFTIAARYLAHGAFVHGVPARHLTWEEWDALTAAQREEVIASQLYELSAQARVEENLSEQTPVTNAEEES